MSRRRWFAIAVVALLGLALRLWILRTPQGALNADESFTGLQAMEIVHGDVPVIFQGQAYTAVPESYFFAPFVALFGAHVMALKLFASLWWAVAAVLVYRLLRPVVGSWSALLGAAFVWIAPGTTMVMSLRAYEGYGSGVVATLLAVLAAQAALRGDGPTIRRSFIAGFSAGLAFYIHPMFVAVALPTTLIVSFVHRRAVKRWWMPAGIGALLANVPFLLWNLTNDWDSLDQPTSGSDSPLVRLGRFFTELAPRTLGLRDFDGHWTLVAAGPIVAIVILALVAVGAVSLWRRGRAERVLVAPLVLAWPLMSLFGNLEYVADGRYGIIVFPFVVIAVVVGGSMVARKIDGPRPVVIAAIAWIGLLVVPWAASNLGDTVDDPNADVGAVVDALTERGISRVAGNFWWVLPVEYQSDRRIRGEVVGNPYVVRLPESHEIVEAADDSEVAFVFDSSDDDVSRLRMPIDRYERREVGRAVLYVPLTA